MAFDQFGGGRDGPREPGGGRDRAKEEAWLDGFSAATEPANMERLGAEQAERASAGAAVDLAEVAFEADQEVVDSVPDDGGRSDLGPAVDDAVAATDQDAASVADDPGASRHGADARASIDALNAATDAEVLASGDDGGGFGGAGQPTRKDEMAPEPDEDVVDSAPVGNGQPAADSASVVDPIADIDPEVVDYASDQSVVDSVGETVRESGYELPDFEPGDVDAGDGQGVVDSAPVAVATLDNDPEVVDSSPDSDGQAPGGLASVSDAVRTSDQELVAAEPREREAGDGRSVVDSTPAGVAALDTDQDAADSGSVGDGQVVDSAPPSDAARETDQPAEGSLAYQGAEAQAPDSDPLRVPDAMGNRPRDALFTFEPEKAGLPPLTMEQAERYLETVDLEKRPWLKGIDDCSREARYVIAAIDLSDCHALARHEGHGSGQNALDRLLWLHDMANVDDASRLRCEDAFEVDVNGDPKRHSCGARVTAINDLNAFATAFAAALQHPEVVAGLARTDTSDPVPLAVHIPVAELLGPNGHDYCEGYQLKPVNGGLERAAQDRTIYVKAGLLQQPTNVAAPICERIESFESGTIACVLTSKADGSGYTIATFYPKSDDD